MKGTHQTDANFARHPFCEYFIDRLRAYVRYVPFSIQVHPVPFIKKSTGSVIWPVVRNEQAVLGQVNVSVSTLRVSFSVQDVISSVQYGTTQSMP